MNTLAYVLCIPFVAIIFYLCYLMLKSFRVVSDRKRAEEARRQAAQQELNQKEDVRLRQQRLYEKYLNSPLLIRILNTISGGDYQLSKPHEINIYDYYVEGLCADGTHIFDFNVNRVEHLEHVGSPGFRRNCEEYLVRPQVALADAINTAMGGEYNVNDCAMRSYDDDFDGYFYSSDHVCMKLKANCHF